jgi:uncharacterized protein
MRWFMDLAYPLMRKARHRKAAEAATALATATDFEAMRKGHQALVVTFKRSGEPVPTPINHALSEDGRLFFRSEPAAGKIKRIRNGARVLVGPCNYRGKPRGPLAEGRARILSGIESERAAKLVRGNWSPTMSIAERSMDGLGVPEVYVEVIAKGLPGTPQDST